MSLRKVALLKLLAFHQKDKHNVDKKAESGVPCKITKFNCDEKDKDVISINYNTNVEEAGETSIDFRPVGQKSEGEYKKNTVLF